jgi:hypothetical protein
LAINYIYEFTKILIDGHRAIELLGSNCNIFPRYILNNSNILLILSQKTIPAWAGFRYCGTRLLPQFLVKILGQIKGLDSQLKSEQNQGKN